MAVRKLEEQRSVIGMFAEFDRWLAMELAKYPKASNKSDFYSKLRKDVSDRQFQFYDQIGQFLQDDFHDHIRMGVADAKPRRLTRWREPDYEDARFRANRAIGNVSHDNEIMDPIYQIFDDAILNRGKGMTDKPTLFDKIKGTLFRDLFHGGMRASERGSGSFPELNIVGNDRAKQTFYKRISDNVAKKLHEDIGKELSRALTLQRSFNTTAYRAGQIEAWEHNADQIVGWTWKANLSNTTCPVCIFMHGSKHSLSETLNSHRNCRCKMVPILGDDLAGGSTGQTGEEWFTELSDNEQLKILGPTRYVMWKAGDFSLEDMIRAGKDPLFGATLGLTPLNMMQSTGKNAELERRIISDIKDKFPNLTIDLNGIAQELRIPFLEILEQFGEKYPEAVDQLDGLVTKSSGLEKVHLAVTSTAHVSTHPVAFIDPSKPWNKNEFQAVFDDGRFDSVDEARVRAKRSYDEQWLTSDHPLGTVHHELAHVAWNNLKFNFGPVFVDETGMSVNQYYNKWLQEHHTAIDHPSKYASESKKLVYDELSADPDQYLNRLTGSHAEPEAENYSNVMTAKLKLTSSKMHVHFLDEMYKMIREGVFKPSSNYGPTNPFTPPLSTKGSRNRKKIETRLDWRKTK